MGLIADQRAALAALIDGVTDSGVVYPRQPLPKNDWAAFIRAFTIELAGQKYVRAWTLGYLGEARERMTTNVGSTKVKRILQWQARLHWGWKDSGDIAVAGSDEEFGTMLETVADAIEARPGFGLAGTGYHRGVQISVPAPFGAYLGDVLVHYGELTITTVNEVTIATS